MSVTIEGVSDVMQALERVRNQATSGAAEAVQQEAVRVRDDARANVPVVTGSLQAGIEIRTVSETAYEVGIYDPDLYYAIWVEWGRSSSNFTATPFATPAAEQSRQRFPGAAARLLKDRVG